jgi:hypothetical protein
MMAMSMRSSDTGCGFQKASSGNGQIAGNRSGNQTGVASGCLVPGDIFASNAEMPSASCVWPEFPFLFAEKQSCAGDKSL